MAVVLAVLGVAACAPQPSRTPDFEPSARYLGNDGYALPDDPFTRKGSVITATCQLGARYAGVSVLAWDPEGWTVSDQRTFSIPINAVYSTNSSAKQVNSALVDLCDQGWGESPVPEVDALERRGPRIRALFDLGFTRMAVVLQDPESTSTYAASVGSDDNSDPVEPPDRATTSDEQNAVMSPDGRRVWFTYTAPSGEQRIGSRAVSGNRGLSDQGPAAGHDLPLTVAGKPPLAIQADMVRIAPNGRRFTADAPKVFGNIFDPPIASAPLTSESARNATLAGECVGMVGWIDQQRVLCRTSSGAFQSVDARSGNAVGAPITVVGPYEGTVAEGMLVSSDGKRFIAAVHLPNNPFQHSFNDPYRLQTDFRVVPTTPGGKPTEISHDYLSTTTFFLEWR